MFLRFSSVVSLLLSRKVQVSLMPWVLILISSKVFAAIPLANDDFRYILIDTPISINVLANDTDADNDALTIVSAGSAGNGIVEIVNDAIRYTPNAGFSGIDSFTYVISDGQDESNSALIQITVTNEILNSISNTENDKSVGSVLDTVCSALIGMEEGLTVGQGRLKARCSELLVLVQNNPGRAARLVNQVAPEETIALMRSASSSTQSQSSAVSQRLSNIGSGINTFSLNGLALNPLQEILGRGAGDSIAANLGYFVSAQIQNTEKGKTSYENGFVEDAYSLTFGLDYRLGDEFYLGAAGAYSENELEYSQQDGEVSANTSTVIGYALYTPNNWSLDIQAGLGITNFSILRQIIYLNNGSDSTSLVKGDTASQQGFIQSNIQYQWHAKNLSVTPSLSLNYHNSNINTYTENNPEGFAVVLQKQSVSQTTVRLGVQAQNSFNLNWGVFIPMLELAAMSEQGKQDDVRGEFLYSPIDNVEFILRADEADTFYGTVGIGASAIFPRGFSGFFKYDRLLAYENISSQRFSLGFRLDI